MELRHLRYVIAAADHGSFRRAASEIGVNESALSRRIRDLEDEIGVALFNRLPGGVQLTQAGERFLKRARHAVDQLEHATVEAAAFGRGENGAVKIGILSSLASGFLCRLLHSFSDTNADVRLDVAEGTTSEHLASVRHLRLDIAFITEKLEADDLDTQRLWCEQICVAMPERDPLTRKMAVSWADLRDRHLIVSEADGSLRIHDYLVSHMGELGDRPRIERHFVGRDNLMSLVAMGQGLALTTEVQAAAGSPDLTFRPLDGTCLRFFAVWSPRNDNPALRRLLSLAKRMSREQDISSS